MYPAIVQLHGILEEWFSKIRLQAKKYSKILDPTEEKKNIHSAEKPEN